MKTIKIFAVPSHDTPDRTSGVDFARVIQPMNHLNGYETEKYKFKVDIFSAKNDKGVNWLEIIKKHDLIFFNYTASAWSYAAMACFCKKLGKPFIMDVDDFLPAIRPDNSSYAAYKANKSEALHTFKCILNDVEYFSTTNNYLRNALIDYSTKTYPQSFVIPNYIDLDIYNHRSPFKDDGQIRILHFGSTSHFLDLQSKPFEEAIDRIFKRYPNVTLKCIGAHVGRWKMKWGQRYEVGYGHQDIYQWIKEKYPVFMDESDICVAPLEIDVYNKCKSDIKRLECAAGMKPFVGQKIRQYEESISNWVDGIVAGTADEWYNAFSKLIESPKLRKTMAQEAFARIERDKQMKDHIGEYAMMVERVHEKGLDKRLNKTL
jgi:glycosyltransferase involved in cell wall biosynthesis